jgi:ankyrin repeat protein
MKYSLAVTVACAVFSAGSASGQKPQSDSSEAKVSPGLTKPHEKLSAERKERQRRLGASFRLSEHGQTPLYQAVVRGQKDVVEVMIEKGAKANHTTHWKHSLLHVAAASSHRHSEAAVDIARLLIRAGADVNGVAKSGLTPLHEATLAGSENMVKVLVEHGAKVDSRLTDSGHCLDPDYELSSAVRPLTEGRKGVTSLDLAQALQMKDVAGLLSSLASTEQGSFND